MYRLLILASLVSALTMSGWAQYGALAIDSNQGTRWGTSAEYSSQWSADQRALSECGSGCHIVVRIQNQCAAYAADQASGSTVAGWATASGRNAAENRASWECRSRGGTACRIRVWGCSLTEQSTSRPQRID